MRVKVFLCAFLFAVLLANLCGCTPMRDDISKEAIINLVHKNYDLLMETAQSGDYDRALQLPGIKSVYAKDANEYIDYYCGGYGFASATGYVGFYYSPSNTAIGIYADTDALVFDGNGYGWKEVDGDNSYYTEKILDFLFYYEANF